MKNKSNIIFWAVMGVLIIALLVYIAQGCTSTRKAEAAEQDNPIMECVERLIPTAPYKAVEHAARMSAEITAQAEQAAQEAEQAAEYTEDDYAYQESDYANYSGSGGYDMPYSELYGEHGPVPGMPGWYDGNVETIYEASGHYLASEWTLDSEGFYHDSEGRYVIGVSIDATNPDTGEGYKYGDVVQTGKGEAVVYDYGQGVNNVHDFATSGW